MHIHNSSPYTASRLDLFAQELLTVTHTGKNDYLLIDPYSMGDVFATLSLVSAFREKHCKNGEKVNLICNPRCAPIANMFGNINTVLGLECGPLEYHFTSLAERYGPCMPHTPIIMTPDMYGRGWMGRLCQAGKINMIDARKLILELDLDLPLHVPALDASEAPAAYARAAAQGLTQDSIIIFNHANTTRSVEADAFLPLKDVWGDNIFYDATMPGKGVIPWAKPLHITLPDVPYFSDYAGTAMTIRSGVTDILSFSSAKLYTVYPSADLMMDFVGDKEKAAKHFRMLTLKNLGFRNDTNETPIFMENSSLESLQHNIKQAISIKSQPHAYTQLQSLRMVEEVD